MPRGPEHVGAQDGPAVQRLIDIPIRCAGRPLGDGPFRARVVLGLDGAEPFDNVNGAREARPGERVKVEPAIGQDAHDRECT